VSDPEAASNPSAVVSDPEAASNPSAVVSDPEVAINPSAVVSDPLTAVSVPDVVDWAQDVLLQLQACNIDSCHLISVPCGLLQQLLESGRCI